MNILKIIFIAICFCLNHSSTAQTKEQVDKSLSILEEAFKQKKYALMDTLLAPAYTLGAYHKNASEQIIPQILVQYPNVLSFEIESYNDGVATVIYHIEGQIEERSIIRFNSEGKIMKIQFFDTILALSSSSESNEKKALADSLNYLNKKQLKSLYALMCEQIDNLDAEGVVVRNTSKDVDWDAYVRYHKRRFVNSKNWVELQKNYLAFGDGFVNLHSHFIFNLERLKTERFKSEFELSFGHNNSGFFSASNGKEIMRVNGVSILDLFYTYTNYQCAFNSEIGCKHSFKKHFEGGGVKIDNALPHKIMYVDGTEETINFKIEKLDPSIDRYARYKESIDTSYYDGWKLVLNGHKVALYKKENMALIRIKDFVYFKGQGGEYNCDSEANDSTMCADIRILRNGIKSIRNDINVLVFDVQGNVGGNENTPFIAEFAQMPFYDLAVQYRKTEILEDGRLRNRLLYSNSRGENWYTKIRTDGTYDAVSYGDFLPARADFCQGSEDCSLEPIAHNKSFKPFEDVVIITNQNCVSSCDDFVWRMKRYGNAKIVGQPHAADATYARIGVVFYMKPDSKEIYVAYKGESDQTPIDGIEIGRMVIPYSRTVDAEGNLYQGVPVTLDKEVNFTHDKLFNVKAYTLNEGLEILED